MRTQRETRIQSCKKLQIYWTKNINQQDNIWADFYSLITFFLLLL